MLFVNSGPLRLNDPYKQKTKLSLGFCLAQREGFEPKRKITAKAVDIINSAGIAYHPQLVAVYHQHEVLHLIKPQIDAR